MDLFLFGENAEPDLNRSEDIARFHLGSKSPLKQITAELLNDLVAQSEADYVAFQQGNTPLSTSDLKNAIARFDDQSDVAVMQMMHRHSCDPFDISGRLPASVAILVRAPESESTILLRKSGPAAIQPFADVAAPIWDRLIQFVLANHTIVCFKTSDSLDGNSGTVPVVFQEFPVPAPGVPGRDKNWLLDHLQNVQPEKLVSPITSAADAVAVKAGLLLIHDYLDESHTLSQSIQGEGRHSAGDYWHAIMHRREPDDSNSKYWFRRVGEHPIFAALAEQADRVFDFVTDCNVWLAENKLSHDDGKAMQKALEHVDSVLGVLKKEK
ncbi:MAG: hypothetical protein IH899_08905, partial [Planctomycetes bacterium]|nr:hypothetical protein [Planctomycetota bacterium]